MLDLPHISKFLCNENKTIRDAMTVINENARGVAFVVNSHGKMVGIVTDGDIRRALLSGRELNDNISLCAQTQYAYVNQGEEFDSIREKFSDKIIVLPVINNEGCVIDYLEYDKNMHYGMAQPQMNGNEFKYLQDAFFSTWISSTGEYITRLEQDFSSWCGKEYGVLTSNGTTALHLALMALGIAEGDEVIVPNLTFAATINAVIYTGAKPVIVDIEEDSWCIDPKCVEEAINSRTKAIIPVHIYGQPCNMDAICDIADQNGLFVVEDCAEAHGAKWKGQIVGSFGHIACFSFFGNKVMTTGEGGVCITNDAKLYDRMRTLRDHGMSKERRYYHEMIGYNYRMTNLQAAIGVAQLEHISEMLRWRCELEEEYRKAFLSCDKIIMQRNDLQYRDKITWLVSVLVDAKRRDDITSELKKNGVDVRNFFIPLSDMEIYKGYVGNRSLNVSERISSMGINLPTTYYMNSNDIDKVVEIIKNVL